MTAVVENVYSLLIALHESRSGIPEGHVYVALGMDLDSYHLVRTICTKGKLIEISGNYITLTPKGSKFANELAAAMESPVSKSQ